MKSIYLNFLFSLESDISAAVLKTIQAENLLSVLDKYYFSGSGQEDARITTSTFKHDEAAALLMGAIESVRTAIMSMNTAMLRINECIDGGENRIEENPAASE
jgi:hypothetical protein